MKSIILRCRFVRSFQRLAMIAIMAMICLCGSLWTYSRSFSAPPDRLPLRNAPAVVDRNVRIAIIGDSWASGRKLDDFVEKDLHDRGWNVRITSHGHPGARSQLIYRDMFAPQSDPHSSQDVLFGAPFHAAVVLAGVNDSQGYIGADHYSHHVRLIVEALSRRGIFPLVVELPEYGIEQARSSDPLGRVRRRMMRMVYHHDQVDVIPMYRSALAKNLQESLPADSYRIIDFDPVATDFNRSRDLYLPDAIHLSEKGRRALSAQIGLSLDRLLRQRAGG